MTVLGRGGLILLGRILQAGAAAVAGWEVARVLGPSGQGRFSLLVLLATAGAALLNGGVGLAAVPPLRRGELPLRDVWRAQLLWIAGAVLAAVPLTWLVLPRWPDLAPLLARTGTSPVAAAVLAALAGMLLADVMAYDLNARGRVFQPPAVNAGRAAAWCLLALLLGEGGSGAARLIAAYAAAHLLGGTVLAWLARREDAAASGRGTAAGVPVGVVRLARRLWWEGRTGQLSAVVSLLHLRLDLAVVALFHPPAVVGVYSVAVLVGEMLWLIPGALQPLLMHSAAGRDRERDRRTLLAVRWGVAATALGGAVLLAAAPALLPRLFGPAYAGAVPALRALLPGIVVFAAGSVLAGDFIGRGRAAWNTRAGLLTLAVNLAAGLLLIPAHGAVGAAWASSLAYAAGSLDMLRRFHRATGLPWRDHLHRISV